MYFRLLHDAASGAMSYLLADLRARSAVLIDPRAADVPVLTAMLYEHRLRLEWVLRTHEHDSQRPGEGEGLLQLNAPVVARHVRDEDRLLAFGDEHLRVLSTPGHTAGCLSFLWRDRLFCGDLLVGDACPWQPVPAQPEAMWDSVTQKVFALPNETLAFGAHARKGRAVSTVFEQRRWHPWFAGATRDEFLLRMAHQQALVENREAQRTIAATRGPGVDHKET